MQNSYEHDTKFLITGAARSGTLYMAELFCRLGYRTGHETIAGTGYTGEFKYSPEAWPDYDGESSCHIVTFWDQIPTEWPILHIIRHPIKVVTSLLNLDVFTDETLARRVEATNTDGTVGHEYDTDSEPLRALRYVADHLERSDQAHHQNRPYLRVQLETINPQSGDLNQLRAIVKHTTGDNVTDRHGKYALGLRQDYNASTERLGKKPGTPLPWTPPRTLTHLLGHYRDETMQLLKATHYVP